MGAFRSLMQIKLADEALKAIDPPASPERASSRWRAGNLIRQDVQDFMDWIQQSLKRILGESKGDENKLAYFRRPLLSKYGLMFTHQVTRYAGFLSDSTANLFLWGPCASSDPRLDRGERARDILNIL